MQKGTGDTNCSSSTHNDIIVRVSSHLEPFVIAEEIRTPSVCRAKGAK